MSIKLAIPALALAAAFAAPAMAAEPIYAPVGTPNAAVYSFQAVNTGAFGAYYLNGSSRSFTSRLVVLVNGMQLGAPAFNTTTAVAGSFVNFGNVVAGDTIEFKLQILAPGSVAGQEIWSTVGQSTPGVEDDGLQQIFSDSWAGGNFSFSPQPNGFGPVFGGNIPLGNYTFVAFEDILGFQTPRPMNNDFDYNDHRFAFNNVANIIPEPATWAMMIAGFGMVGFALRRRASGFTSVAA